MLVPEKKAVTIRQQIKKEEQAWHNKERYGGFSYYSSHGFGYRDNTEKPNMRDDSGKVKTGPKNFMGGRPRTAHPQIDSFTKTGYLCTGDEYINPSQTMRYRDNSNKAKQPTAATFRPSGMYSNKVKAPYEYIADPMQPTQAGNPRKNFTTSPMKKGLGSTTYGHLFSTYRHETDPHDDPETLDRMERKEHHSKILNGPFQITFKKRDFFTPNRVTFRYPATRHRPTRSIGGHDQPFLATDPVRKGYNCTINRFPHYAEEGVDQQVNVQAARSDGFWKYTHREKTMPCPSINNYNALNRPNKKL